MEGSVILNTGPLVAYLDSHEEHHDWAVAQIESFDDPMVTCEAVITEACFLLSHHKPALAKVADYLTRGLIRIEFSLAENHTAVFELMKKYHDVPMALADACLVSMAEEVRGSRVFTVDSDFRVYRLRGRKAVPLICPD